jgi:glycosyltransferase involved in cell wall biosynthesis
MSGKTFVPETQTGETELAALLDEARQHVERLRRLESEAKQLVADLRARAFAPALLPWSYRWRHVLANLAGVRLGRLYHHAPRPFVVPSRYPQTPVPADPPAIAIVTPSYNQGVFLERTLRSVLDQKYPRLEYIVQDGGSKDDSPAILARYHDRLAHWESAPDGGQAPALNTGFRRTTGEIMAYLNADDLLLPGSLAYVAGYFAEHPEVDVVYGHRVLIDADEGEIGRWVLPRHSDDVLSWVDFVPQETLFWRRGIWERVGGKIDESFHFAMDWDLLLRFREAGAKFVRLPRFLGAFRVHALQKTQHENAIGKEETARLRRRLHGRDVSTLEIMARIRSYILRHAVCSRLYYLGLLRH